MLIFVLFFGRQFILLLKNNYILIDCKSPSDWKGINGKDLDGSDPAQGTDLGAYQQKSLSQCKTLCESNDQCFSIHYHTWQKSHFSNCNLKDGMFSDQSQITNEGGDWTLYWLFGCTSGSQFTLALALLHSAKNKDWIIMV